MSIYLVCSNSRSHPAAVVAGEEVHGRRTVFQTHDRKPDFNHAK
jgi:hypothetical protein